jgi:hypothetical protein
LQDLGANALLEDPFADIFGPHRGPFIHHTASTGFPTATSTATSGLAPAPVTTGIRKLKVKYDLAPTSAPFVVAEPTFVRARNERRGDFNRLTTGTGTATGTAGPTGTGSVSFPTLTTFATALRPLPTAAVIEEPTAVGESEESWIGILKRWIAGEQAGLENVRIWGNVGEPM